VVDGRGIAGAVKIGFSVMVADVVKRLEADDAEGISTHNMLADVKPLLVDICRNDRSCILGLLHEIAIWDTVEAHD